MLKKKKKNISKSNQKKCLQRPWVTETEIGDGNFEEERDFMW